ncbi:hypothetical protein JAAARDRAFT_199107 [Jaapia argillacea MUCL 33604]|uniref:Uncharacterized protein n=1 Tax=Jaapia argillacea MUCL 33604 TaxID=933084 RepID=A0A067P994_9AGAM|nr:hypothetical protein JAAARDRAFT_199107 [Jaapia argillacea MUCL 33604]
MSKALLPPLHPITTLSAFPTSLNSSPKSHSHQPHHPSRHTLQSSGIAIWLKRYCDPSLNGNSLRSSGTEEYRIDESDARQERVDDRLWYMTRFQTSKSLQVQKLRRNTNEERDYALLECIAVPDRRDMVCLVHQTKTTQHFFPLHTPTLIDITRPHPLPTSPPFPSPYLPIRSRTLKHYPLSLPKRLQPSHPKRQPANPIHKLHFPSSTSHSRTFLQCYLHPIHPRFWYLQHTGCSFMNTLNSLNVNRRPKTPQAEPSLGSIQLTLMLSMANEIEAKYARGGSDLRRSDKEG